MDTVNVKIDFVESYLPTNISKSETIKVTFPLCSIPNIGDSLSANNIKNSEKGTFYVLKKHFSQLSDGSFDITLLLGLEEDLSS